MQQDACLFHDNLSVYGNYGGIVLSDQEGRNIGEALGPKHMCCIMQNHGLLTCAWTQVMIGTTSECASVEYWHRGA
jgi:hypothetical protein